MEKIEKKLKINKANYSVSDNLPYVNLESPQVKEQIEKLNNILRNLKQPLPISS
jgi:hypothetical protein